MTNDQRDPERDEHPDLPETLERAKDELSPEQYDRALHAGQEAAERATLRESARWVIWLVIGATVVAALVADWRFLLPAAVLMVWYSLPYILAAEGDAADDAEAEVVDRATRAERD